MIELPGEPVPATASGLLRRIGAGLLLVGVGIAAGCSDSGSEEILPPLQNVSFANQVQPIFTGSCTFSACHDADQPQAGMNLTQGNAYAFIVNVQASNTYPGEIRVVPGDLSESLLYQKLTTTNFGSQMPLPPGSITQRQRDTIKVWIEEGAKNN